MDVITRGSGLNESERYLAGLADRTFLNLWSYPNVYKGVNKELCDLLVVCGDNILIFSDKRIQWPTGMEVGLAWQRWYRRAVHHSVTQIRGAERWIQKFPEKLYLDRKCTQPLPLRLPPADRRKITGIAVTTGAGLACKTYFNGGRGSLMLFPEVKGEEHMSRNANPFAIGDVAPDGPFVHVLDEAVLDIVMSEMDTITDFTRYLSKKEALIRSGHLGVAAGEEELVAWYATHLNSSGEHDFAKPDGSPLDDGEFLSFDEGLYDDLLSNPQYRAKKAADKDSYVWDDLITRFTDNLLAGTNITVDGMGSTLGEIEEAVRQMVLVPRFRRRFMGRQIREARRIGTSKGRFISSFVPSPDDSGSDTGFFFMTLEAPPAEWIPDGYQDYRRLRLGFLQIYGMALLRRHSHLKRVVGIASEPLPKPGAPRGSSEDLIMIESPEWTDELLKQLEEDQAALGIMQEGQFDESVVHHDEYPAIARTASNPSAIIGPNRRERRAMKAASKKKRK